jgi:hypothetical protein
MSPECRDAAHRYLDAGYLPIGWAIIDGTKAAVSMRGRHYKDYRVSHRDIEGWRDSWQVGLAMCEASGHWALDFDCGQKRAEAFFEQYVPDRTATQLTGRGFHLLYRGTGGAGWPRDGVWSADWLDVQVRSNGFIAAWPSLHPSGRQYRWQDGHPVTEPGTMLLAGRPERVKRPRIKRPAPSDWFARVEQDEPDDNPPDLGYYAEHGIPVGWQDTTLHQLACKYVRSMGEEDLFAGLWAAAVASSQSKTNPWRPEDIRDKIRRAREFTSDEDAQARDAHQAFLTAMGYR